MTSLLVELIKATPKDEIGIIVYLLQGKLYPDYVGVELGLAEKLLIKAAAETTGKTEKAVDEDYKRSGDLGLTIEKLLQKRSQSTLVRKQLTVKTVYDTFDKIAHAQGSGSVETKIRLLGSLLNEADAREAKFIARMAVVAADRNGVSFYHYDSICSLLQMELETYLHARNALIERDLIAFDGTRFQVLSLPEQPATHSVRELRTPEDFAEHDAATIRVTLRRSFPRGGSEHGNGTP